MKQIQKIIYGIRFNYAVNKASRLAKRYGRKYVVINRRGKLVVIAKKRLTELVRQKYFRPGVTAGDLERKALHVALPKSK